MKHSSNLHVAGKYVGDFVLPHEEFEDLGALFSEFSKDRFAALPERQKIDRVNGALLERIQKAKEGFFLIPALSFIDRINQEKVLEHYTFAHFELYINQFAGLSVEENYRIRASLVGKHVPREAYQAFFPISMGKMYPGSHFVTAHQSADLDTTIASFWGWIDAFGARVAEGNHVWNIPGGPPMSQVEIGLLFQEIFGKNMFTYLAKTRSALSVSSLDLMTQKGVVRKETHESTLMIDHERNQNAIVLVDAEGTYLGDWRNIDVEGVRQVVTSLNNCLRWFENHLHAKLISLFAKDHLSMNDLPTFVKAVTLTKIKESKPLLALSEKQKWHLQDYLTKVLGVAHGLESTFEEFAKALKKLSLPAFQECIDLIENLGKSSLFNASGQLVENRSHIFHYLEKIILGLDLAIQNFANFVDRLDIALQIKTKVFGYLPQMLSYRADIEEIRSKMGNYSYLTVTYGKENNLIPLGVVHATDLHKSILGTVSLRDFCNRDEAKIPSYLEIISVIDHHKSNLQTSAPSVAILSDAQSSNSLVALLSFAINDAYSLGGMTLKNIEEQIQEVKKDLSSNRARRILQRLLQKQILLENNTQYFVDPKREFVEYLHFLYGILDDTDLLTKVSAKDVECCGSLLNRMKSLLLKKDVEVVDFDGIERDQHFATKAASLLMQNADMYSLYSKIYLAKENAVEQSVHDCIKGKPTSLFADTKEQNGCCRVGQTKMFAKNFPTFLSHADAIRSIWLEDAQLFCKERPEVDLHLHMISTIAGALDLFSGMQGDYPHKDEIWIWIPSTEQAAIHLKTFLNAFKTAPQVASQAIEVEFSGENAKELKEIFGDTFPVINEPSSKKRGLPIAVLRFKAGTINSRKAIITPYLPKLG